MLCFSLTPSRTPPRDNALVKEVHDGTMAAIRLLEHRLVDGAETCKGWQNVKKEKRDAKHEKRMRDQTIDRGKDDACKVKVVAMR